MRTRCHTGTASSEDHVCDLENALRVRLSSSNDWTWFVHIVEGRSTSKNNRPDFADYLRVDGDSNSICDDICSMVEEDDLTTCILCKGLYE